MLGVDYQTINCLVKGCEYNERHEVLDGDDKLIQVYFTCEKDTINVDSTGKCKEV